MSHQLEGTFIFISGPEYYNYGLIETVFDGCIMVKFYSNSGPRTSRLFSLVFLSDNDDVLFFNTMEQLTEWLTWLETPSETENKFKLIDINKKH